MWKNKVVKYFQKEGDDKMFSHGNAKNNVLGKKEEANKYHEGCQKIDLNNVNDSHSIIVNNVKKNSVCLDVGCASGAIGESLHQEKNCQVIGIEMDKAAIQIAEKRNCYQKIYPCSITEDKSAKYQEFERDETTYDYIIFADILEHLVSPDKVILNLSKKLKPKGKIIISIPNIAHIDILLGLINRTFNYNHLGILDNTHLRFFTKNSFHDMIRNLSETYGISLRVKEIGKTTCMTEEAIHHPELLNILNQDNEVDVVQYIYELTLAKGEIQEQKEIDYCQCLESTLKSQKTSLEELAKVKENYKALEEEYQKLKTEYQNVINSKSWKVTKPLRSVTNKLKQTKK